MKSASALEKIKTIGWTFRLAWKIDKKMLLFWLGISSLLSIFPAIALLQNKNILSTLSAFLASGTGEFSQVIVQIIMLGLILTVIGLSSRINGDLVYMMMYDSYYLGMEELLIDKVQKIDYKTLLKKEVADEYNSIIYRAGSLTDFMSASCTLLSKIISVLSLLAVAFTYSKVIFGISLIYIIVMVLFNMNYTEKIRHDMLREVKNERTSEYFQRLPLTPGVAKEIRIFGTADSIEKQWQEAYLQVAKQDRRHAIGTEISSLVGGAGFYLFMIIMLVYAIYQVANHSMTADVFLMIYTMCQSISTSLNGIAKGLISLDYGLFSLERQRRFVQDVEERREDTGKAILPAQKTDTVFELKNVSFGYNDSKLVLKDINLKIKKGEKIALVGYNGSGKTTLTKLLLNLYQPNSGEIFLYGRPYSEYQGEQIQKSIGIFFQDYYMFHASMRENVGVGDIDRIEDLEKIRQSIVDGDAEKVLARLPKGLENWIGKDIEPEGAILSGGEKQKIAVSRTHMSDREIMIFDEPTAALDPIAETNLYRNFAELTKDKTTILISHRFGITSLVDRILVFREGSIVEDGSFQELIEKNGYFSQLYRSQAKWYESAE